MAMVTDSNLIMTALQKEVRLCLEQVVKVEAAEAAKRVEAAVNAELDRIALKLLQNYSMERIGPELLIRVHKLGDT
jgi:hypothetical protein